MNNIIVDANIIFSSFIKRNSRIREYLLREDIDYFSPGFVLLEIEKHRKKLVKHSELTADEIITFFHHILRNINFIRSDLISKVNMKKAYELCKDIDEKDTIYVALTLELNGLLWTGDKKLVSSLNEKGFGQTIISPELFSSF